MKGRWVSIILLFILFSLLVVPNVYAQSSQDIDIDDIISAIGPRSGQELIFDVLLYAIFFMGMVNMFLIPEKQLMPTMLNFIVIGLAVVSKLLVGTEPDSYITPGNFATLVFNSGMFVLPLITAGMVRSRFGTPKAMITCAITGLIGGGYFFIFWALEQRTAFA